MALPQPGAGSPPSQIDSNAPLSWKQVRQLFELRSDRIHMSCMLMASHPTTVREAIERHKQGLQLDPVGYIENNRWRLEGEVLQSASSYLGVAPSEIALTDSTSMGLALLYTGLKLNSTHEILTTVHDHYATETAIALCAERTGCAVKRIALYRDLSKVSEDELVNAIRSSVAPNTRIVAVTWVHSSTGLKIPIRAIAHMLAEVNAKRDEKDRVYLCVDGVHGLGVENFTIPDLGCDFFAGGTHKWIFGPRGLGSSGVARRLGP